MVLELAVLAVLVREHGLMAMPGIVSHRRRPALGPSLSIQRIVDLHRTPVCAPQGNCRSRPAIRTIRHQTLLVSRSS